MIDVTSKMSNIMKSMKYGFSAGPMNIELDSWTKLENVVYNQ